MAYRTQPHAIFPKEIEIEIVSDVSAVTGDTPFKVVDVLDTTAKFDRDWFVEHCGDVVVSCSTDIKETIEICPTFGRVFIQLRDYLDYLYSSSPMPGFFMYLYQQPIAAMPALSEFAQCPAKLRNDRLWGETHSVNLWIGNEGKCAGTHFDMSDNFQLVLHGEKRFVLFPPETNMYELGINRQSAIPKIAEVDAERYPDLQHAQPYSTLVRSGEAIYIPFGWWHTVENCTYSYAINFWIHPAASQRAYYGAKLVCKALGFVASVFEVVWGAIDFILRDALFYVPWFFMPRRFDMRWPQRIARTVKESFAPELPKKAPAAKEELL